MRNLQALVPGDSAFPVALIRYSEECRLTDLACSHWSKRSWRFQEGGREGRGRKHGLLGSRWFNSSSQNYSTLLLEDQAGVLYVGARGAIFALVTRDIGAAGSSRTINWEASAGQKLQCLNKGRDNQTECFNHIRFLQRFNETHLYVCGTHAFRPMCTYIDVDHFTLSSGFEDGREKCPYDPTNGYTGLFVDGEMYTASQYDFRSSPDIRRNYPYPTVKTEEGPIRWLLEANFVGSALVRDSVNSSVGDDDKIYFFFTERSQEQSPFFSQTRVARVARVCKVEQYIAGSIQLAEAEAPETHEADKDFSRRSPHWHGDWGGLRTLQKKWTSFLKARLVCSIPDYEFHLNVLRSVFLVEAQPAQSSIFYGVFGLEWTNVKTSAICRYSVEDVQKTFDGPFMESQESKWIEYTGKVPEPRPGSCITDAFRARGINSSRDLPDEVLNFARRHPLMSRHVRPQEERPLLFKRNVGYTQIAVRRVTALDGRPYHVLFIGTDEGWLHRAVEVGGRVHIIEELQLFEKTQPVDRLVISPLQLPLSTCSRYTSCFDCIFARDPFCAWNGSACADIESQPGRSGLIQDILKGNRGCKNTKDGPTVFRVRSVMAGDDVLLQCELRSNLAAPRWTFNGRELQGYGLDSGFRVGTDGLLLIGARAEQSGHYACFAVENGVHVLAANYTVRVRTETVQPGESAPPPFPATERPLPSPPAPLEPVPLPQTFRNMETVYISLVAILGGLCLVLSVVLLYMSFSARTARRGKRGQQGPGRNERKRSSHMELKTISSRCNGERAERDERMAGATTVDGLLQIVPGEGQASPSKDSLPPAPPLPAPPPLPSSEYANGLSATLPSVLRKMNGNSYVLLRQADSDTPSPLYHSFTEELNRILEKRKHTQLVTSQPDESSV
ncbi:semaphorin-4G-like [Scleropages formosus]|uniref:Semaphorin-4G-like n=1 Tax=Scleropages formosus TaxID=113540 RepID=A0A0P7XCP7_SCLFO|nr:semaphorin-4G-like [Scleropages formosus]